MIVDLFVLLSAFLLVCFPPQVVASYGEVNGSEGTLISSTTDASNNTSIPSFQLTGRMWDPSKSFYEEPEKEEKTGFKIPIFLWDNDYVAMRAITVGAGKQTFNLKFDSSLDFLMVFGKKLQGGISKDLRLYPGGEEDECVPEKQFFDFKDSTRITPKMSPNGRKDFHKEYQDGSLIGGAWFKDKVQLRGGRESTLNFGVASWVAMDEEGDSNKWEHSCDAYGDIRHVDAILGIGFMPKSPGANSYSSIGASGGRKSITGPILEMYYQGEKVERGGGTPLLTPSFSFYICPVGFNSHVTIGRRAGLILESDLIDGGKAEVHFAPGNRHGRRKVFGWELELENVVYDGNIQDVSFKRLVATLETARPVVSLPTSIYKAIFKDINPETYEDVGRGEILYAPCKKIRQMVSTIRFDMFTPVGESVTYSLDMMDLSEEVNCVDKVGASMEEVMCRLHIEDSGNDEKLGLGHPFLEKYYTTFSYTSSRGSDSKDMTWKPVVYIGPSKDYASVKKEIREHGRNSDADECWGRKHDICDGAPKTKKTRGTQKKKGGDERFPKDQKTKRHRREGEKDEREKGVDGRFPNRFSSQAKERGGKK